MLYFSISVSIYGWPIWFLNPLSPTIKTEPKLGQQIYEKGHKRYSTSNVTERPFPIQRFSHAETRLKIVAFPVLITCMATFLGENLKSKHLSFLTNLSMKHFMSMQFLRLYVTKIQCWLCKGGYLYPPIMNESIFRLYPLPRFIFIENTDIRKELREKCNHPVFTTETCMLLSTCSISAQTKYLQSFFFFANITSLY